MFKSLLNYLICVNVREWLNIFAGFWTFNWFIFTELLWYINSPLQYQTGSLCYWVRLTVRFGSLCWHICQLSHVLQWEKKSANFKVQSWIHTTITKDISLFFFSSIPTLKFAICSENSTYTYELLMYSDTVSMLVLFAQIIYNISFLVLWCLVFYYFDFISSLAHNTIVICCFIIHRSKRM